MKPEIDNDIFFFLRPQVENRIGETVIPGKVLVIFVEQGTANMSIDGESFAMDVDHMFFIHPRAELVLNEASADFKLAVVAVPNVMKESATLHMDISFFMFLVKKPCWEMDEKMRRMTKGFYNMFEYICHDLKAETKSDLITSLFVLFVRVLYEKARPMLPNEKPIGSIAGRTLISRFGKLLRTHFREDHRVAYYADLLCVTPKYLTQVVKQTVGVTPKDIIDRTLAIESVHQLKHSPLTIQQISGVLGFPDQSYFGRFFKRMFGISPLQFRQNPNMDVLQKLETSLLSKYPELEKFGLGKDKNE